MKRSRLLLAAALALISSRASADLPIQIPYTGFLQQSGTAFSGAIPIQVTLTATDSSGIKTTWTESHATVPVNNGRFNILLGSITPIPPGFINTALASGIPLTLAVIVNGVPLNGTQTIYPSAFANTTTAAKSSASDFIVNGALRIQNTLSNIIQFIFPGDTAGGGGISYRPASAPNALAIDGAGISPNRSVLLRDNVNVNGNLATVGQVQAGAGVAPDVVTRFFLVNSDWTLANPDVPTLNNPSAPPPGMVYRDGSDLATYIVYHNLGFIPSQIMFQACGALRADGSCATNVVFAGTTGFHNGSATMNPQTTYSTPDGNKIQFYVSGEYIYAYGNNTGFHCSPNTNCYTGYYRVLAWR
jgi:hypothetical protein